MTKHLKLKDRLLIFKTLSLFTKLYGKHHSFKSLLHGLPITGSDDLDFKKIDELFEKAAHKAGYKAKLTKKDISKISSFLLPMILLMKNGDSCILE